MILNPFNEPELLRKTATFSWFAGEAGGVRVSGLAGQDVAIVSVMQTSPADTACAGSMIVGLTKNGVRKSASSASVAIFWFNLVFGFLVSLSYA